MNVRELIEHLQQFDPDLPVKVRSRPMSPCIPLDPYPPFPRVGPRSTHILIEEVSQETPESLWELEEYQQRIQDIADTMR